MMVRFLIVFIFPLLFPLNVTFAQDVYKCSAGGSMVYQDRPCPSAARRLDSMPVKPPPVAEQSAAAAADAPSKLDQDKEYINKRVAARIYEREKGLAAEQIQNCNGEVAMIEQKISQVANGYQHGAPLTAADAQMLQLDAQRRQTEVTALQSQATSKRHDCDQLRQAYDRQYRK